MQKGDCFGKNVDRYESWFSRNRPAYESELEAVGGVIPRFAKGLEVGVGTGLFAAPLGLRFGLDPSMEMGKAAINRGIEVVLGIGENLPYRDGCFDLLLMVTTICFLDDLPGTPGLGGGFVCGRQGDKNLSPYGRLERCS